MEDRTSLKDYVRNMKENQEHIYFITGQSKQSVENSPFVHGIKEKGYDVLFLVDPIDEYIIQHIREFDGKTLVNITKDNALFHESNEDYESHLCKKMKELLDVEKVVVSSRLGKSPCCVVSGEYGWSANMERIMKAQTLQSNNAMMMSGMSKKIMEINPTHPMIQKLQQGIKNTSMNEHIMKSVIQLMYDTALVASGYNHEDPSDFSNRIYNMIGLGIDADVSKVENDELNIDNTKSEEETSTDNNPENIDYMTNMEEVD
jgi:molecular chaperone HtpG